MMTPADRSAGDTVRAFLAALGEGERSDLAEYLAEDAEYRGTGIQRPTIGAEPIARLLGMLYAGTGTTAEWSPSRRGTASSSASAATTCAPERP